MKTTTTQERKRILIVNCYFDETRRPVRRTNKTPQAMGPAFLAGAFAPDLCDIKLYNEVYSGPLDDLALLGWPDMLVLTGLTNGLDRMLHLTAYARTLNPRVIVVAGGPAIRAFPALTSPIFDYACRGDVEQLREVITDVFGAAYVAEEMIPRFDLAYWVGWIGHVESSRNCNFRCSFCTMTGEGRGYWKYSIDSVRKQIAAMGRKRAMLFIDNNFYGNDRNFFLARLELIREMRAAGHFGGWSALVTNDFFYRQDNLDLAREAGCIGLFSGVESFDTEWLTSVNKTQNTHASPVQLIRKCLDTGIVFLYGLMLDVVTRSVNDLDRELDYITGNSEITLPSFLSIPIPIPRTPYFNECAEQGLLLPSVKLRDLDGTVLVMRPRSSVEETVRFLSGMPTMRGYRRRIVRHSLRFAARYRKVLPPLQMAVALGNAGFISIPEVMTAPFGGTAPSKPRTWISTTEPLDHLYEPIIPVASKYRDYFKPVMVTDESGNLTESMEELGVLQTV